MNDIERDATADIDAIEWYVSNLRDVIARRPVRGLDEAEAGYLAARKRLQGAVSTKITDEELDAAWSAWSERWVTSSGRDAMREALMTFARLRGGR